MNKNRCYLTIEQALALLPEGDEIHVFSNPSAGVLVGSDWRRATVEKEIRAAKIREIGGDACRGMNHGLALDGHWFVATREGCDWDAIERDVTAAA